MGDPSRETPKYTLRTATRTDIGMRRLSNQDALSASPPPGQPGEDGEAFLMVADGMGAHAAGELASKLAVETVHHAYRRRLTTSPPSALRHAVREANDKIHAKGASSSELHGMGTTCSCLLATGGAALVAHVGDSRVYRLRDGVLEQLTFDHSLVWEMAAASNVSEEKVPSCIPKNVITRSLGPHASVIVDIEGPFKLRPGDTFLLCSDGLTGVVDDPVLAGVMQVLEPDAAAQTLVDLANVGGGPDNVTVVLAEVEASSRPAKGRSSRPKSGAAPLAFASAVACAIAGVVALLSGNLTATTVAAFGLGASLATSWAARRADAGPRPQVLGGPYGDAPYRSCDDGQQPTLDHLRSIIDELASMAAAELNGEPVAVTAKSADRQASPSTDRPKPLGGNLLIPWDAFRESHAAAERAAEAGDTAEAIRRYAAVLQQVMQAVREDDGTHRYPDGVAATL